MSAATLAAGHVVARGSVRPRLDAVVPVLGVAGMPFGVWYALGSVDAVPYAF